MVGLILPYLPMPHRATVDPTSPQASPTPAAPVQPLRTCDRCRYAKGQTPWYHWLSKAPLDTGPLRPPLRTSRGPPRGGVRPPQGMRNPFTFLGQNTHPEFTPSSPRVHPFSPTFFYDAHLVNRGTQRLRKGVHRVSGCWSLGTGVSRPKPIGDHRYLWILILIHIRHNP